MCCIICQEEEKTFKICLCTDSRVCTGCYDQISTMMEFEGGRIEVFRCPNCRRKHILSFNNTNECVFVELTEVENKTTDIIVITI